MMRARTAAMIIGLAAACFVARADEAALARLLPLLSADPDIICAVVDAQRLIAKSQPLVEAAWRSAGSEDPVADATRVAADAKALGIGAVVAWVEKDGWTVAVDANAGRDELAGRLRTYGTFSETRDLWTLRLPRARLPLYATWRGGVLFLSASPARVRSAGTGNVAFAGWMKSPDALQADLVLYQTRGALWRALLDLPAGPLWRRFSAALGFDAAIAQPVFINIGLGANELTASLSASLPPATPARGFAQAALRPLPPLRGLQVTVSGFRPAEMLDFIAGAEDRFDPDAGQEFREELTELNRDLGFDFRKDLLAHLGDWGLSVGPSDEGRPVWSAVARLDSAAQFLAAAQRLAEFVEAGWAEGPEYGDARRFTTSAFTASLSLAVRPEWFVMASSPEEAQRLADWTRTPPGVGDPDVVWRLDASLDLDTLGPLTTQCLPLRRAAPWLGGFPQGSALRVSARRTERQLCLTASLREISLQQLAALATPRDDGPRPPKWVMEMPLEKIDVKTREIVVLKIVEWEALGRNKEGLYRNPQTKEFTMTAVVTCAACGKKVPAPVMQPELIHQNADAYAAWLATLKCPLCGKALFRQ